MDTASLLERNISELVEKAPSCAHAPPVDLLQHSCGSQRAAMTLEPFKLGLISEMLVPDIDAQLFHAHGGGAGFFFKWI